MGVQKNVLFKDTEMLVSVFFFKKVLVKFLKKEILFQKLDNYIFIYPLAEIFKPF